MDAAEYGRLAYVHHRAKASAYANAGEHARAHGHARAAERHRAAAFGDAGAVAGIVAASVVGAGVFAQKLRLKLKQREALSLRDKANALQATADKKAAKLRGLRAPAQAAAEKAALEQAGEKNVRRERQRAEEDAKRAEFESGARAALDAWYGSEKGGTPSRGDGAAFALENRAGFAVDHGGYTFRVVATTVDGDRDVFNADRGQHSAAYVKEQVPGVALVATRTVDGETVTLGERRTG